MSARAIGAAWLTALLALTVCAVLLVNADLERPVFHGRPVAVIGTSLMRHAVPAPAQGAVGLLGDGRDHWRVGVSGASEDAVATLLSRAVDERLQTVFVEANPLLFDYARTPASDRCSSPGGGIRVRLAGWRRLVTDAFAHRTGRPGELDEVPRPGELDRPAIGGKPVAARGIYPLSLRGPCGLARLREIAARAADVGTRIVLVLPPRSMTSSRLLGARQTEVLAASARALAVALGAQLFSAGPWPDTAFIDGEHLNRQGRARFIGALRDWWRTPR